MCIIKKIHFCVWKQVKSTLEFSLIWLWKHSCRHYSRLTSTLVAIQDSDWLFSKYFSSSPSFRKLSPDHISPAKPETNHTWSLLDATKWHICRIRWHLDFTKEESWHEKQIWSGLNIPKQVCSSASYPTATKHWTPCRILMVGMWKRWCTATDERRGGVNKMERRWNLEITIVRPNTGHTHL